MTAMPKNPPVSAEEYLANEYVATTKSEYFFGEVFAMSGASYDHTIIGANIIATLRTQLRGGPCRVHTPDLRIEVRNRGIYAYPDVAVVCGKPEFSDNKLDMVKNPRVLIEILSPSTEHVDRGIKAAHYREIPSLSDYLLVWQIEPHIEHYHRAESGTWELRDVVGLDAVLPLPSIKCALPLREVYEDLEFA